MSPYSHDSTGYADGKDIPVSFKKERFPNGKSSMRYVIENAVKNCGDKQSVLAIEMELSESELSKKISGERGWSCREIDQLIGISGLCVCDPEGYENVIRDLKTGMKALLTLTER